MDPILNIKPFFRSILLQNFDEDKSTNKGYFPTAY